MNAKIETFLPVFNGFYNTNWEMDGDEAYCTEHNVPYDRLEIDHQKYMEDVAKKICEILPEYFPKGMVLGIEFQSVVSPREYNFHNDSINVVIKLNVPKLKNFLNRNKEWFAEFLKDKYTPRSGFIPYYSNNIQDWKEETRGFTYWEADGHRLGSVLNFVFDFKSKESERDLEPKLRDEVFEDINQESYITYKPYDWEDLSTEELTDAVQENLSKMDLEFGYTKLLVDEAKHKAQIFGSNWVAELENSTKIDLLSSIGTSADELKIVSNQKSKK